MTETNDPRYKILVDNSILELAGYKQGEFIATCNIFKNTLGSYTENRVFIDQISTSRKEIRIRPTSTDNTIDENWINFNNISKTNRIAKFVINFGKNKTYLIANWLYDTNKKYNDGLGSYVIKLYDQLPDEFTINDQLWISEILAKQVSGNLILEDIVIEKKYNKLQGPNFNIEPTKNFSNQYTDYKNTTDLVSSNSTTRTKIVNNVLSSSYNVEGAVEINVDYSDYINFVHFGSAYQRLKNFYNKKYSLELYQSQSDMIQLTTDPSGSSSFSEKTQHINDLSIKMNNIVSKFDGYEKYMYYESSSNYIDTYATHSSYAWPKSGSYPNINENFSIFYPSASTEVSNWYYTQSLIAEDYDRQNIHNLVNTVPSHVQSDEYNEDYLKFIELTGQYFDTEWIYIKHITDLYKRENNIKDTLSKDLIYEMLKSLGVNINSGNDLVDLWEYSLGTDITGSLKNTSNNILSVSNKDITNEIWNRILNNLPYLLKAKGTKKGIRGLVNCYGIPTSLLDIEEYGGPITTGSINSYEFDTFNFALDFNNSQSIECDFNPETTQSTAIELRFKLQQGKHYYDQLIHSESLFNTDDNAGKIKLYTVYSGSIDDNYQKGYLRFSYYSTSSTENYIQSDLLNIYDNEFWNVLVISGSDSDGYKLLVNKYDNGSMVYSSSVTSGYISSSASQSWDTSNNIYFGKTIDNTPGLSGSLQEIRLWSTEPSQNDFNNHTTFIRSIVNTNREAYYSLITRYTMNFPTNLFSFSLIDDSKPNNNIPDNDAVTSGFINNTEFPYQFSYYNGSRESSTVPNLGLSLNSNKTRIVDNGLNNNSQLDINISNDYFSGIEDFSKDSNKIGVYFSPTKLINKNLIEYYSSFNFDNFIGDPRNEFKNTYEELNNKNKEYWDQFGQWKNLNNYWDYLKLMRYYDNSLFDLIKEFTPGRADTEVGVTIKPHILDRSKMEWKPLQKSEIQKKAPSIRIIGTLEEGEKSKYQYKKTTIEMQDYIYINNASKLDNSVTIFNSASVNSSYLYKESPTIDANSKRYSGFTDSVNIEMIKPVCDLELSSSRNPIINSDGSTQVTSSQFRYYRQKQSGWWNVRYAGCLQTQYTTLDGKDPVESILSNPNTLIVDDQGSGVKLKVQ